MRFAKTLAALATAAALITPAVPAQASTAGPRWTGAWSAAVQQPSPGGLPGSSNWSQAGFKRQSVRQVIRVTGAGVAVRIKISNLYGTAPLTVSGATVAKAAAGAAIRPATLRPATFSLRPYTVIPAGQELVSDPIPLPVQALDRLAVTLYFQGATGPATFHDISSATSYRAPGDHRSDPRGTAFTDSSHSWYFLSGVDVLSPAAQGAVVTFGDSVTDGTGSTLDADNRYPDQLAERLVAAGRPLTVLNSGISGNQVLADHPLFGESGLARFQRDVLDRPGVRTVIVMEGINDITYPGPVVTAEQVIAGHRELIRLAHARGIRVVGGTIMPFKGNPWLYPDGTPEPFAQEQVRDQVNTWIRSSGEYDAVADFEQALRSPTDPDRLRPEFNVRDGQEGDRLHPNDAGLNAMAEAIDLSRL
ncbi:MULTISPECIES: SGNH/GDSL hydrolase family protein [Streptosporangium]|uniref:Lysophospholipase L1-like esterase n=1 Tax=Streptosporangium brasiliense TaxID=47480 RepID=A0ABT9RI68_9ACTN|nr:SGNH/GDSL hydrolase family protein [Streptosporangium brasiliense]MDP9868979.1 lysophospholipase L1-like esterase [Streptosporangium brasiliense]